MQRYFFTFLFILIIGITACSRQSQGKDVEIVTIQPQSLSNSLYYSGTIQPLRSIVVATPADGVIIDMPFQYGEKVKAGQLLFMISSAKFLSDYKAALMAYIKAKNEYNNAQTQLNEGKFLHKNLLISDDEFKTKKSNYYANRLALLQAKDALEALLSQSDIKNINFDALTIADVDKINQALHLQTSSENLRILAPASGVVLSPSKSDEDNKKINKGDAIKQNDALAVIGDMDGLTVRIKVNELTVNQLRVGQKVQVTGIAFPDQVLEGEIKQVDRQGESSGGGLPSFPVQVVVPKLSLEQQKSIHVGMSAKVEIKIDEESRIMVPIVAIDEKNGLSYVKVFDEKTRKTRNVAIKTGKTTMDSVAVLAGLQSGDKIVVPH